MENFNDFDFNRVFNEKHLLEFETPFAKEDLFYEASQKAFKFGYLKAVDPVVKAFKDREKLSSTGFEQGFAIPHARNENVKEPVIFIARTKSHFSDWESLDGSEIKVAFLLFVPQIGDLHVTILSTVATLLLDLDFQLVVKEKGFEEIKSYLYEALKKAFSPVEEAKSEKVDVLENPSKKVLAITACPSGIAHTFIAKEKLETYAKNHNIALSVETQGGNKQLNKFSQTALNEADEIIIASDIKIDLKRFLGKKVVITSTKEAIKDPEDLFKKLSTNPQKIEKKNILLLENNVKSHWQLRFKSIKNNFLASFNQPWKWIFFSSLLYSFFSLLAFILYGQNWVANGDSLNPTLFGLETFSLLFFELFLPLFLATFAMRFHKSETLYITVFILTFLLNTPTLGRVAFFFSPAGINGSIVSTPLWFDYQGTFNISSLYATSVFGPLLFLPLAIYGYKLLQIIKMNFRSHYFNVINYFMTFAYVVSLFSLTFFLAAPVSYVITNLVIYIVEVPAQFFWARMLIGFVIASLIVVDNGSTINKFTLLAVFGLSIYDIRFRSIALFAIPIASLSVGQFYLLLRKFISLEDLKFAKGSWILGIKGLSEGPIELINKYKLVVALPAVISSGIAGAIVYMLNLQIFNAAAVAAWFFGVFPNFFVINDIAFLNFSTGGQGGLTLLQIWLQGTIGFYFAILVTFLSFDLLTLGMLTTSRKHPFQKKEAILAK